MFFPEGTMGYSALIIDDEPIIRMDLADQLASAGFQVLGEAGDGYDAVGLARRYHPDVVLMDINMPMFDGLTAAGQIMEEHLAKTVIMITSFCDDDFVARASKIGVGGYLVKPIRSENLLPAIEIAMGQSQRFEEARKREEEALKKIEEQKVIGRAKSIIARKQNISEREALAFLQKASMGKRVSMAEYAARIVETYSPDGKILKAKQLLMEKYNLSDRAAYKRLKSMAEADGCTIGETAAKILGE